jgi:hypothetical protein
MVVYLFWGLVIHVKVRVSHVPLLINVDGMGSTA